MMVAKEERTPPAEERNVTKEEWMTDQDNEWMIMAKGRSHAISRRQKNNKGRWDD